MKNGIIALVCSMGLLASCQKETMSFENPLQGTDLEDSSGITYGYLLEPFTSVSCGACPLAHYEVEQIEADQRDVFHMSHYLYGPLHHPYTQYIIERVNKTVYTPLSFVQRANNNGSVVYYNVDRYNEILEGVRTSPVHYDLNVEPSIEAETIAMDVEILPTSEASDNELGVTAILVEKLVTGTGSGYDQRNYGHNDESHPYYGQGNYIEGFEHTNVIRHVLTPFEGAETSISQDPIELDFAVDRSELAQDPDKYAVIVFVSEDASVDAPILNARYYDLADL